MDEFNIIAIIIAGITTGGLTCFAVQGGLLTSALSQIQKAGAKDKVYSVATFVIAKVIIYTIVGAMLGSFGSVLNISPQVQAWLQVLIGLYMIAVTLQLLNVHPIFRYAIIQPPAKLQRLVRKVSKGNEQFTTPALLGLMTIFIPCGTTLAMEALAISTQSWWQGALTLGLFTLSSSWIFFAVGLAWAKFSDISQVYLTRITAAVLIVLAFLSINSGLTLLGVPYTLSTLTMQSEQSEVVLSDTTVAPAPVNSLQRVTMEVLPTGYRPSTNVLQKDVPVELTLNTQDVYTCAIAFTIPSQNISKVLKPTGTTTVTFTPTKKGKLVYSCSMGMYGGYFTVK